MKRIPTHKKCKCKKFCSQTRLVGEIYSSDVIMHRGYSRSSNCLIFKNYKPSVKVFKKDRSLDPLQLTSSYSVSYFRRTYSEIVPGSTDPLPSPHPPPPDNHYASAFPSDPIASGFGENIMATPLHVRCKSKSRVRLVRSSLRKHPFLLALRRWGRFARKVPSGEERGETDVFAG